MLCMNRAYRNKVEFSLIHWTVEQDGYLIENHSLSLAELQKRLPFTEDQIIQRKERLGLFRRERQLKRL